MQYSAAIVAFIAASGAIAAPAQPDIRNEDITVRLTGAGNVRGWDAIGASPTVAKEFTFTGRGPFNQVQLIFSDNIKKAIPGIETTYRCALERKDGAHVAIQRGENFDFNFGDGNVNKAWNILGEPLTDGKVKCDPAFKKLDPNDRKAIRVTFKGGPVEKTVSLTGADITKRVQTVSIVAKTVQLFVGPQIDLQALRCQIKGADGNIIKVDRGTNLNKETFGDAGKGAWKVDVAGDGIARAETVTCDPSFK